MMWSVGVSTLFTVQQHINSETCRALWWMQRQDGESAHHELGRLSYLVTALCRIFGARLLQRLLHQLLPLLQQRSKALLHRKRCTEGSLLKWDMPSMTVEPSDVFMRRMPCLSAVVGIRCVTIRVSIGGTRRPC